MIEAIGDKVPTMRVARAVIINDQQELLLVRRRSNGLLEIPGGKHDNPLETFEQAVKREVGEETGLLVEPFGPKHQIDCHVLQRRAGSPYSGFKVVMASQVAIVGGELQADPEEVSELVSLYIPELSQIQSQLTPPTIQALGFFGLNTLTEVELPISS